MTRLARSLVAAVAALCPLAVAQDGGGFDKSLYEALQWRNIGPFRGGRCTAVCGVPEQMFTFYFGSTGGGVWKTTDGWPTRGRTTTAVRARTQERDHAPRRLRLRGLVPSRASDTRGPGCCSGSS